MINKVKTNGTSFPTPQTKSNLFEDYFAKQSMGSDLAERRRAGNAKPAVNVREDYNNFVIEVAAPGITRDDFNIELTDDVLTISANINESRKENDGNGYTRQEFSYAGFERKLTLPGHLVVADEVSLKYNQGILFVTIPKSKAAEATSPAK